MINVIRDKNAKTTWLFYHPRRTSDNRYLPFFPDNDYSASFVSLGHFSTIIASIDQSTSARQLERQLQARVSKLKEEPKPRQPRQEFDGIIPISRNRENGSAIRQFMNLIIISGMFVTCKHVTSPSRTTRSDDEAIAAGDRRDSEIEEYLTNKHLRKQLLGRSLPMSGNVASAATIDEIDRAIVA